MWERITSGVKSVFSGLASSVAGIAGLFGLSYFMGKKWDKDFLGVGEIVKGKETGEAALALGKAALPYIGIGAGVNFGTGILFPKTDEGNNPVPPMGIPKNNAQNTGKIEP